MTASEFPFSYPIASQVLGAAGLSDNWGNERIVNAVFVNQGGANAILTLYDSNGVSQTFQIISGAPVKIKRANVRSWSITGNGATIQGMFSWPAEPEPSAFQVGTRSGAGATNVDFHLTASGSFVALYTVPLGFRATLLRATLNNLSGSDLTFFLAQGIVIGGLIVDWITPPAGSSVANDGYLYIGSGPGNNIQIPSSMGPLIGDPNTGERDILMGYFILGGAGLVDFGIELYVQPL